MDTGNSSLAESLKAAGFAGTVQPEEPLAPFTTWQIGGPAEILATPAHVQDLERALSWATRTSVPWRVLGNGSNLLIHDSGVRGLVLRVRKVLNRIDGEENVLNAGAGASLPALANAAASRGLSGLEFAAGIPGSVGGAILMNAGWHEFETGNVVRQVDFLHGDGRRATVAHDDCAFAYRTSAFRHMPGIILAAEFVLHSGDTRAIRQRLDEYAAARKANQPVDRPSCGSVYIQPPGDYAGRLIEQAGLKGTRVGAMEVSTLHANFFINRGGASCADALALMALVEEKVALRTGVHLVREVEFWS